MKSLIVYYSFTQNNEKLAHYLKGKLDCDIERIETKNKRTSLSILFDLMFNRKPALRPTQHNLADYDKLIFVAPIWAGKIAMPLKSFLVQERTNIKEYSFITLCGGGRDQKAKIEQELESLLHKKPQEVVELWATELLPVDQKGSIKYTTGFRMDANGFGKFEKKIDEFIKKSHPLPTSVH